jgi:hypothetical protein
MHVPLFEQGAVTHTLQSKRSRRHFYRNDGMQIQIDINGQLSRDVQWMQETCNYASQH